jgi:6-phosphofructokinase 1
LDRANGRVYGVYNSFRGLCQLPDNLTTLDPQKTEEWLDQGGSQLGIVRYYPEGEDKEGKDVQRAIERMADVITTKLEDNLIDILYVIGGDGSLRVVHEVAQRNPTRSIVGIPKTMDNDILWVWQSFGFNTAVEQATYTINKLRTESQATRRICIIELFGAESGFVAANATLASGHVDAVLIPEVFKIMDLPDIASYLEAIIGHIDDRIKHDDRRHSPHAVIVVAEGVGTVLEKKKAKLRGTQFQKPEFVHQLAAMMENAVRDAYGEEVPAFVNQPRHYIRAVPANPYDQIYCERLGALAVDNALAGYTNFMISQWLTEYVLVPTRLVIVGQKSIPVSGMFWKQVVSSTGQPLSAAELTKQPTSASDKRTSPTKTRRKTAKRRKSKAKVHRKA